jgi:Zn-dependent peptidase ImmA (M78 family)
MRGQVNPMGLVRVDDDAITSNQSNPGGLLMASGSSAQQAQSAASMEATRLHRRLGTSFEEPVDVLSIARNLELVLMMQPLESLLGFYVRGDETSGVVINSQLPESLQRFTLAHEIGHHVLGHEGTVDDEHALDRFDPTSLKELAAQAFAASLLMPLPLVTNALRNLPATRQSRRVQPTDAYLFSRQLGVSYSAGVWALYRRRLLSLDAARAFIKRGALEAKAAIRGQDRVADARADVWVLTAENNDLSVMCRVGDEIQVELPEDTSSGLAWLVRPPAGPGLFDAVPDGQPVWSGGDELRFDDTQHQATSMGQHASEQIRQDSGSMNAAIEIIHDEHLNTRGDDHPEPAGRLDFVADLDESAALRFPAQGGIRSVTFVPRKEGDSRVLLELARPWDPEAPVRGRYELDLHVRPKRLAGQGLFAPTADSWVADHVASA